MSTLYRGSTIQFSVVFQDITGAVTQPGGAVINLNYIEDGASQTELVTMTPPSAPATNWTAQWDSRNVMPGTVTWSIHTTGAGIPFTVQDGSFLLSANNANLPSF